MLSSTSPLGRECNGVGNFSWSTIKIRWFPPPPPEIQTAGELSDLRVRTDTALASLSMKIRADAALFIRLKRTETAVSLIRQEQILHLIKTCCLQQLTCLTSAGGRLSANTKTKQTANFVWCKIWEKLTRGSLNKNSSTCGWNPSYYKKNALVWSYWHVKDGETKNSFSKALCTSFVRLLDRRGVTFAA
jgi:hypothetical protein